MSEDLRQMTQEEYIEWLKEQNKELRNKLEIRQRGFDLEKQRADNLIKDNDRLRQVNNTLADEVVKRGGTINGC